MPDVTECSQMEVIRTDDDDDMYVEGKFNVQCYSEDLSSRMEDSARLIQLSNLLTRSSDVSFRLGRVEKKIVSDIPSGDCIGACRKCCQSGW